jgi:Uma2 family endonuclease
MTTQTAPVTRYRFTADQYEEMIRTGILTEHDRVELIDGEVIDMPLIEEEHVYGVTRIGDILSDALRGRVLLQVENPVRLGMGAMPEPDIALLRRRPDYYRGTRPGPEDIFLLVEVADTSLSYDRTTKARLYANAGIPEYWVHDVKAAALIVHRDPSSEGYRSVTVLHRGDRVALLAFPDREIAVTDLLGEAP